MRTTRRIALFFFCFIQLGCNEKIDTFLKPKDFLNTPSIINPTRQYGHLLTDTVVIPAHTDIFLAGAEQGVSIDYPEEGLKDIAPENSPVALLEGIISGGETLDIYATGKARHLPLRTIAYGPRGWVQSGIVVQTKPIFKIKAFEGTIGALVGIFDNQDEPFIVGQHKQIKVPRGARILYMAMLDYPGASSDNEGQYTVTIDVIRR